MEEKTSNTNHKFRDSSELEENYLPEKLSLSQYALENLDETRKWTKFFAILGLISSGLLFIGTIIMCFLIPTNNLNEIAIFGSVYIGLSLICLFPSIYFLRFSNQVRDALLQADEVSLEESFVNLRKSFRFLGIMTISMFILFLIAAILFLFSAFFML